MTDKRIIYKTGFINRHTEEMNMDKVPRWMSIKRFGAESSISVRFGFLERVVRGCAVYPRPGIERLDMIGVANQAAQRN